MELPSSSNSQPTTGRGGHRHQGDIGGGGCHAADSETTRAGDEDTDDPKEG